MSNSNSLTTSTASLRSLSHRCDKCGYSTLHKNKLNDHVKYVHDKVRDKRCPLCDAYASSNTSHVYDHIKTAHPESVSSAYRCDRCPFATGTVSKLAFHRKTYHEGKSILQCDHCDYFTVRKKSMKEHTAKQHPHVGAGSGSSTTAGHHVNPAAVPAPTAQHQQQQQQQQQQAAAAQPSHHAAAASRLNHAMPPVAHHQPPMSHVNASLARMQPVMPMHKCSLCTYAAVNEAMLSAHIMTDHVLRN